MIVSDFVNRIAAEWGEDPREFERYTRVLREAGMFPERVGGRKISINAEKAATLLLAVLGAQTASRAATAVKSYGSLPCEIIPAFGSRTTPQQPTKTLLGFLILALEKAHSEQALRRTINVGTLYVLRGAPAASFDPWKDRAKLMFRASALLGGRKGGGSEGFISGDTLTRLSFALADLPEPAHLL